MPDVTYDLDYSDDIARLAKHPGYTTLPPRTTTRYLTLHYSGVVYADRSHAAELNRILNEARYQLHHDYSGNGSGSYPDGLLYDCVILSDGTCVRTRARPQQLWHCGNATGNAQSYSLHLMLGPGQDATPAQWQRVLRVIDEVRAAHAFPARHIVGHCEWPRRAGAPQPSAIYRVLPDQSECPGRVLHARLAQARAAASTPPVPFYSADSAILGLPRATLAQATAYILSRPHGNYTDADIRDVILPAYWETCLAVGVDPILAIAQMSHEGALVAFWGKRPQRNPAGIGVTGHARETAPVNQDGWAYNPERERWERGVSFATWKDDGIPAHVGRLLAYVLPVGIGTPAQRALIEKALTYRVLPRYFHGTAPTLKQLGRIHNPKGNQGAGWASPGAVYGAKIAEVANAIARMPV
jgi:hypothetical protein